MHRIGIKLLGVLGIATAIILALVTLPFGVEARDRVVPINRLDVQKSFAPVVQKVAPAVVNVYVRQSARKFVSPFRSDPYFRKFFGRRFGVPRSRAQNSLGSGVIVSADGFVVTNYHVIKGGGVKSAKIKIALADKREYDASIVLSDKKTDLAILKINAPGRIFPFLEFDDSDDLLVGDLVLAIGNPFGVGQTVTSGIVSALSRSRVGKSRDQLFIQTDAAINPGNSGGALVDMHGHLIGINTMIFSRSGGSNGIGFAIPSNQVKIVVDSAASGNKVERPWFGARLEPLTASIAEALGREKISGALVSQVYETSPAADAGMRPGDVILTVDGRDVADPRSFNYRFNTRGVGGHAALGVLRRGKVIDVRVALKETPSFGLDNARRLSGNHPFDGANVADLTPVLADELGISNNGGVIVLDVRRRGLAARVGLRSGDIIERVNAKKIRSLADLQRAVARRKRYWRFVILRNGQRLEMAIRG